MTLLFLKATVPTESRISSHLRSVGEHARFILPYVATRHRTADELPTVVIEPPKPIVFIMPAADRSNAVDA